MYFFDALTTFRQSQLATLRQYDHYTHDVEACVPPTVLLTEVEENLSPDVLRMLNFVKAVTGVHHSGSAKKCLARILASRFHLWVNANATKVVTTEPQSLAHAAARRYVVSELALLRTAWERELRFMTPVHSDASLQALLEMDITTVSGTQDGRGQVFSGRRISPPDPTSVCVSCADFLPEVQTVYL